MSAFQRETFELSRAMEFFSERELTAQIGYDRFMWPTAILRELLDNAADACESAGIPPDITVDLKLDCLIVQDNGPGLPIPVIERSLDYAIRVSDKTGYVSPSRGQQGNALKTLYAAPFVATGTGLIEVETQGQRREIRVELDRVLQRPQIELTATGDSDVKNGTRITLHWRKIASTLLHVADCDFYMTVYGFKDLNPHISMAIKVAGREDERLPAHDPNWTHWQPTAPHWYTVEQLRHLIALLIGSEQRSTKARSVNEFIREFRGLTATAKARDVAAAAGLQGAMLRDFVKDRDLDLSAISRLLSAMQEHARPVKPAALGVLGQEHCAHVVESYHGEGIQYRCDKNTVNGLPYVLEVAFAILPDESQRRIICGINFTIALYPPFQRLTRALSESLVQSNDPVIVLVHFTCPSVRFTDRGKTRAELPDAISDKLMQMVKQVTKAFTAAKRQAGREDNLKASAAEELRKANERRFISAKAATWRYMPTAYAKVSNDKKYPANARQIMYASRKNAQAQNEAMEKYFVLHSGFIARIYRRPSRDNRQLGCRL